MTLGFSQEIKGVKNFFVPKIWKGIVDNNLVDHAHHIKNDYEEAYYDRFNSWIGFPHDIQPKLHTIRQGLNRWRAGIDIHMVINNRTANRFQFAPTIKCKSVQKIQIIWSGKWQQHVSVLIDDFFVLPPREIQKLAINDGFDSVDAFFEYFNKDFTGQLIHWTDLKY